MWFRWGWVMVAALAALGCNADARYSLLVDVIVDRPAGEDFDRLDLSIEDRVSGTGIHSESIAADPALDYSIGARLARVEDLEPGQLLVSVQLRLGGELVDERELGLDLRSDYALTLSFPAPPCAPEACNGLDDDCDGVVDESDPAELCALEGAVESECVAGACEILVCEAARESCDGDATTGCETDLDSDTDCGGCGVVCDDAKACDLGACRFGGRVEAVRTLPIEPAGE